MNPIIEAIDAGHIDHGGKCVECKTKYPCTAISEARVENVNYVSKAQYAPAKSNGLGPPLEQIR